MKQKLVTMGVVGLTAMVSVLATAAVMKHMQGDGLRRADVQEIVAEAVAKSTADIRTAIKESAVNVDVLQKSLIEIARSRVVAQQQPGSAGGPDRSAQIKSNAAALFDAPHQATFGNPQGDVTLVEFFDYNCGFCKRALADKLALLQADPQLRIVVKDYPILGPASVEASQVAVAARLQDGGERYLAFHKKLMGERRADRATAMTAAKEAGFDTARIERDIESDDVKRTLSETNDLARTLGISGTPTYVVGGALIVGAVGQARLLGQIKQARLESR